MLPETCFGLRKPTIAPVTVFQGPRHRQLPWRASVFVSDRAPGLNSFQIARQKRFLEVGKISPPVFGRKICDAFALSSLP